MTATKRHLGSDIISLREPHADVHLSQKIPAQLRTIYPSSYTSIASFYAHTSVHQAHLRAKKEVLCLPPLPALAMMEVMMEAMMEVIALEVSDA